MLHRSWVTCVVIRFSMNRFVGFTQIDPGWSEASEEKQRLGTSSAYCHNAWAAMLDWCLLRFCCLVFKKPTCLTGMWYVFSWKELEVWMWYEWQWHQTFPIFRDTCFLDSWSPWCLIRWSDDPMIRWSDDPMVHWSDGPVIRWSDGPMVRWSDDPLIRRSNGPMVRWSDDPMVRWSDDPLVRWSAGPLIRRSDDPMVRWSADPTIRWSDDPLVRWSADPTIRWSDGPLVRWSDDPLIRWSAGPLIDPMVRWSEIQRSKLEPQWRYHFGRDCLPTYPLHASERTASSKVLVQNLFWIEIEYTYLNHYIYIWGLR